MLLHLELFYVAIGFCGAIVRNKLLITKVLKIGRIVLIHLNYRFHTHTVCPPSHVFDRIYGVGGSTTSCGSRSMNGNAIRTCLFCIWLLFS